MCRRRRSTGAPHRTRLILKDGSYQLVMSYQVKGKVVSYVSAERGETRGHSGGPGGLGRDARWERQHHGGRRTGRPPAPAIDPELLKEEADRAALTPEVAPDLSLPEQEAWWRWTTFEGTPELVPLVQ